jgi:hypothetical protein
MITKCQACGKDNLLAADVVSRDGYGPELLPGTGIFSPAHFTIVVCSDCGFVHWFVRSQDLKKVKGSKSFTSIKGE